MLRRMIQYIKWRLFPPEQGMYAGDLVIGYDRQANWIITLRPETVDKGEMLLVHRISENRKFAYSFTYLRPAKPSLRTMAANGKDLWWKKDEFTDIGIVFSYSDKGALAGYGYLIWKDGKPRTRFNFSMEKLGRYP